MVDHHQERAGNIIGGMLVILGVLVFAAVITYNSDDISWYFNPPAEHPHNILGRLGAWLAFFSIQAFGLGAYAFPVALMVSGAVILFSFTGGNLRRLLYFWAMFLAVVCILQLGTAQLKSHLIPFNIDHAGGVFGYLVTDSLLIRYLSFAVAAALLFIALLVFSILMLRIPIRSIAHHGLEAGKAGVRASADGFGDRIDRSRERAAERRADRLAALETEDEWEDEEEEYDDEDEFEEIEEPKRNKGKRRGPRIRSTATPSGRRRNKYEPDPLPLDPYGKEGGEYEDDELEPIGADVIDFPETTSAVAAVTALKIEDDRPWETQLHDDEQEDAFPERERAPKKTRRGTAAKSGNSGKSTTSGKSGKPKSTAKRKSRERLPVNPPTDGPYKLPSFKLLDKLPSKRRRGNSHDVSNRGALLVDTLNEFGVKASLTDAKSGPVVTTYELLPAPGVRVERIASLSNNIALSLKAESIRVQAPIPGKGVVGIEIPNAKATIVYAREIMESKEWDKKRALPLLLGKDAVGREIILDLADMPHLLIAGATGSGKSVCMNSLLAGLLMSRSPEQLRLLLVDPKIVEFTAFNDLPHLVTPVITDPKKVSVGLKWAIDEMTKRYKMFAKVGVRNIKSFNSRPKVSQADMFEEIDEEGEENDPPNAIPDTVPYIVIVIDELADLMMVAQSDVENAIARLAQLSRAVGIHMVIATQRPSVNVITGTIKANFPARIAFQVAQKVDSRTILDANGADKLLGRGDMLLLPPGTSRLVRAQGAYTTDDEINRIVAFIKSQAAPEYETTVKEKIESKTPIVEEDDADAELIEKAKEIIRQTQRASTSSLQRRLRIGYNRAARLMDKLEAVGVVGPPRGSDPREILIDLDGEIPSNKNDYEGTAQPPDEAPATETPTGEDAPESE